MPQQEEVLSDVTQDIEETAPLEEEEVMSENQVAPNYEAVNNSVYSCDYGMNIITKYIQYS